MQSHAARSQSRMQRRRGRLPMLSTDASNVRLLADEALYLINQSEKKPRQWSADN